MTENARRENRRIVLRRRPVGLVQDADVELVTAPVGEPGDGEILMQVEWLGIDASVRTWLNRGEGYLPTGRDRRRGSLQRHRPRPRVEERPFRGR